MREGQARDGECCNRMHNGNACACAPVCALLQSSLSFPGFPVICATCDSQQAPTACLPNVNRQQNKRRLGCRHQTRQRKKVLRDEKRTETQQKEGREGHERQGKRDKDKSRQARTVTECVSHTHTHSVLRLHASCERKSWRASRNKKGLTGGATNASTLHGLEQPIQTDRQTDRHANKEEPMQIRTHTGTCTSTMCDMTNERSMTETEAVI